MHQREIARDKGEREVSTLAANSEQGGSYQASVTLRGVELLCSLVAAPEAEAAAEGGMMTV
jgi:hypothetical protein